MNWIPTDQQMPPPETPVLILLGGEPHIGELRWDHPGFEDSYSAYLYWDNPNDDGQAWDHGSVTHWMEIPKLPGFDEGIESEFFYAAHPEHRPKEIDFNNYDDGIPF